MYPGWQQSSKVPSAGKAFRSAARVVVVRVPVVEMPMVPSVVRT